MLSLVPLSPGHLKFLSSDAPKSSCESGSAFQRAFCAFSAKSFNKLFRSIERVRINILITEKLFKIFFTFVIAN